MELLIVIIIKVMEAMSLGLKGYGKIVATE